MILWNRGGVPVGIQGNDRWLDFADGGQPSGAAGLVLGLPFLPDLLRSALLAPVGRLVLRDGRNLRVLPIEVLFHLR